MTDKTEREAGNRKSRIRRARDAYDVAGRKKLRTAGSLAALSTLLSASGKDAEGADALSLVERAIRFSDEPAADRGRKFGPKPRRHDALSRSIEAALVRLGKKASAEDVLQYIERDDTGPIQEIKDFVIYWNRGNGREAKTTHHRFETRVSEVRRKIFKT